MMIRFLTLFLLSCLTPLPSMAQGFPETPPTERVIVLHGLGRTSISMNEIARKLRDEGYEVENLNYRSTEGTVAMHIRDIYRKTRRTLEDENHVVNFVCHSLGCLITRGLIHQHRPARMGRVVMLGPPNQGSEMADYLRENGLVNWLLGPTMPQLGTANRHMLEKTIGDKADYPLGIIAGKDWIDPFGA
ncbi:MAG: esterase/lipase family protein, partial [Rickettsiales bacterium]